MNTYPLLALPLVLTALIVDGPLLRSWQLRRRRTWKVLGAMGLLTLVFDSLLTGIPIVTYQPDKLLGLMLGSIPLEDFSYAFAAVLLTLSIADAHARSHYIRLPDLPAVLLDQHVFPLHCRLANCRHTARLAILARSFFLPGAI